MKLNFRNDYNIGIISSLSSYILWGILPVYWKLVETVPPLEILSHRFIWSFVFVALLILITKNTRGLLKEMNEVFVQRNRLFSVITAALVISLNWYTYIWAVNNDHIVDASLGYYINPLVSVLLGIIFLKEKLSFWQVVSFILAAIGVLNLVYHFGNIPWIALTLALSFGIYGLCKKIANLGAINSIALETLLILPVCLIYTTHLSLSGNSSFCIHSPAISGLLMTAGIITATPLLLFSKGAKHLPLYMVGFIQYVSPTISLILGIYLYHEPFSTVHLTSFIFIWIALTIFSFSQIGTRGQEPCPGTRGQEPCPTPSPLITFWQRFLKYLTSR